jgi:glucose-1-phosphate adenylyltransferase
MRDVLGLILGGGRGARLFPLTKHRSEPAVPIAGKYRLIDIPISNCLNNGVNRVYVLTQYLSVSLHKHIANTYKFDPFSRGFVEVLAAQQTYETADWYQGTADAIRQNIRYLQEDPARYLLILSGDQLYRMNFRQLLAVHGDSHADVTMSVVPVTRDQAKDLGVVRVDESLRITGLVEKPRTDAQLEPFRLPAGWLEARGVAGRGREYLANMGIYVFTKDVLLGLLAAQPRATDLLLEIFTRGMASHRIHAHVFGGYWQDVGTIQSYHEANLALASEQPPFDFHSSEGVIFSRMRYLPASRVRAAHMRHCLVSDGCVIEPGARLERCVVGLRSRIGRHAVLRDTVLIGADRYETEQGREDNHKRGVPDLGVGEGSLIERAILDKDCRIGRNVQIVNQRELVEYDGPNYHIRERIVVIPNGAVVPDGTII